MNPCDCSVPPFSRREFIKTAAGTFAAGTLPLIGAEKPASQASETLVTTLFNSLKEEQRKTICFPFDHELRSKVDNNWMITKEAIDKALDKDQQQMVREIFMGLHSDEYAKNVYEQVKSDGGGNFEDSVAVALFGEPGTGKFEFVLTGRHCTRRCDGDSVEGAAFGGPIFYGHAAEGANESAEHKGNAYWFQAKRANEVFQALDGKQRAVALLDKSRGEKQTETVKLTGKATGLPGIAVGDLTFDQKGLVKKVLADLLMPFRKPDADEAMKSIEANGLDKLHLAFYKGENIGEDEVWDVWQIEGPNMVWYFRGKPHVHVWAHVRAANALA
jgi:Protein of unknown function (DUF3500)